jgi:hypothetical protein|tara:strand:- start:51 stop:461 length:411 start_codon:yes stop_codon:yes gene_type:complete
MKIIKDKSELKLPSNKKFGFFFSVIFLLISSYYLYLNEIIIALILGFISVLFFFVSLLKAGLLLPLNIVWMKFGILLGKLISPIVLGTIFFFMFTPVAVIMRLVGRDELRLRLNFQDSYWIKRKSSINKASFKRQF